MIFWLFKFFKTHRPEFYWKVACNSLEHIFCEWTQCEIMRNFEEWREHVNKTTRISFSWYTFHICCKKVGTQAFQICKKVFLFKYWFKNTHTVIYFSTTRLEYHIAIGVPFEPNFACFLLWKLSSSYSRKYQTLLTWIEHALTELQNYQVNS